LIIPSTLENQLPPKLQKPERTTLGLMLSINYKISWLLIESAEVFFR